MPVLPPALQQIPSRLPSLLLGDTMTEVNKIVTEQEIQDWYDSGPIKPDMLEMWLDIIEKNKDK